MHNIRIHVPLGASRVARSCVAAGICSRNGNAKPKEDSAAKTTGRTLKSLILSLVLLQRQALGKERRCGKL